MLPLPLAQLPPRPGRMLAVPFDSTPLIALPLTALALAPAPVAAVPPG